MLDVLRVLVNELQKLANLELPRLSSTVSTCSHEFITIIDKIENEIDKIAEKYGLQRLDPRLIRLRSSDDLVIAYYLAETLIIEIGFKGLNRCGPLAEVSRGRVKAYGKLLGPGSKILAEVEAEEKREEAKPLYF